MRRAIYENMACCARICKAARRCDMPDAARSQKRVAAMARTAQALRCAARARYVRGVECAPACLFFCRGARARCCPRRCRRHAADFRRHAFTAWRTAPLPPREPKMLTLRDADVA